MATFFGNPESARGLGHWLRGATVYGAVIDGTITAIGSTMVEFPNLGEAAILAGLPYRKK